MALDITGIAEDLSNALSIISGAISGVGDGVQNPFESPQFKAVVSDLVTTLGRIATTIKPALANVPFAAAVIAGSNMESLETSVEQMQLDFANKDYLDLAKNALSIISSATAIAVLFDMEPVTKVVLFAVSAVANGVDFHGILTRRGCGRKLGLPGGSSCIPTKIGFELLSSTSSWASASDPRSASWVIQRRIL